jgi:predicted DsbA family dithiol-disulfide isomerase
VTTVPTRTVEAVRDVLAEHADDLGLDRSTVKALASRAVTARRRDGGLVRLDVSTYEPAEVSL